MSKGSATALDRWEAYKLDPLSEKVARTFRVGRRLDLRSQMSLRGIPKALGLIRKHGVGGHMIHALHAINHPDRLAVVDDRRQVTYAEANAEISRIANGLQEQFGVGRKTPVILMMPNRVEYTLAWFALFRLGATAVHASYRQTPDELAYQVDHSGARTVVVDESTVGIVKQLAADRSDLDLQVVIVDGGDTDEIRAETVAYRALIEAASDQFPEREDGEVENANVVYTSGTTGKPKGAVRDFGSVGLGELFKLLDRIPFNVAERHLVVSPMYHSAGQAFTLIQTSLGATIYLRPTFDPEDTLRKLSEWRIESMFMVPTMVRRILDLPEELHAACPTPELNVLIFGAAAFPQALRVRAIERFGASVIHDFYGATELGWVTLINGEEMLKKPGSVGRGMPGQALCVMDEAGNRLGANEIGIIYVKNEHTMIGYLNDEEATAESMRDGWLTVDDLGYLDEDEYLYLSGRARDMVISGGVNIYPVEIEEVLAKHPDVKEIAVIGVPDEEWGERLVGVVVPANDGLNQEDLVAFGRDALAGFKIPKSWVFREELPRNMTGKVLKRQLREEIAG